MIFLIYKRIKYILLLSIIIYFSNCTTTKTTTSGEYVPPPTIKEKEVAEEVAVKEPEPVSEKVPSIPIRKKISYKIQIFASHDKESSEDEANRVFIKISQPAEVVLSGDLWKVQVGSFEERKDAEIFREKLKNLGWSDAFIVDVEDEGLSGEQSKGKSYEYFSIQVLASENRTEARDLMKNLIDLGLENVFIVFEKNLWKVRAGRFNEKVQAEKYLEKLKIIGFSDCWIVKSYN